MKKKLVIILNDNITDIVKKGEIVERYYNPNNYFEEIHFILINQKKINTNKIKKMSGNAKIYIHNFYFDNFDKLILIFYNSLILKSSKDFLDLINRISPQVIRCYNLNFAIFLASLIKKNLKISYLISLHIDHKDLIEKKISFIKKIIFFLIRTKINKILIESYKLMPVYNSATNYIKQFNIKNYVICYNFIGKLKNKKTKHLNNTFKLICTNRQFKDKNPINIVKAVSKVNNVKLTLVGDGNYHQRIKKYVKKNKLGNKIILIKSIENQKYLKILRDNHALILHSDLQEFGKSVIEAMSLGKPIIINKPRKKIYELSSKYCLMNVNNVYGYKQSILRLIENKNLSKKLGLNGYKIYINKYESTKMELRQSIIYKSLLKKEYKIND